MHHIIDHPLIQLKPLQFPEIEFLFKFAFRRRKLISSILFGFATFTHGW
jgi:hypothetical protein